MSWGRDKIGLLGAYVWQVGIGLQARGMRHQGFCHSLEALCAIEVTLEGPRRVLIAGIKAVGGRGPRKPGWWEVLPSFQMRTLTEAQKCWGGSLQLVTDQGRTHTQVCWLLSWGDPQASASGETKTEVETDGQRVGTVRAAELMTFAETDASG